jgi:hypothetical protein
MNLKEVGQIVWLGLGLTPRLSRLVFRKYSTTSSLKHTSAYLIAHIAENISYSVIGNKLFKQRSISIAAYLISISIRILMRDCKDFEIWYSMMKTQTMNSYFTEGGNLALEAYKSVSRPTNFSEKYEIIKSAAYGSNIRLLEEILLNQAWASECPGFVEFIRGLIKFNLSSPEWIDEFVLSKKKYESSIKFSSRDNSEILPEFYHNVRNFLSRSEMSLIFREVTLLDERDTTTYDDRSLCIGSVVVLVSCDTVYFEIFIKSFLSSLRRHNKKNLVKVILVTGSDFLPETTSVLIEEITRVDVNCIIEVQPTEYNPGLFSSVVRFLSAEVTSDLFGADVVILDVDLSVDFCLDDYFESSSCDVYCVVHDDVSVPWARYNASFFYFKRNRDAMSIIRLSSAYSNSMLKRHGGWTLDQTSLVLAVEFYVSIGRTISIGRIPQAIIIRWSANTPAHLYRDRSQSKLNVLKQ